MVFSLGSSSLYVVPRDCWPGLYVICAQYINGGRGNVVGLELGRFGVRFSLVARGFLSETSRPNLRPAQSHIQ